MCTIIVTKWIAKTKLKACNSQLMAIHMRGIPVKSLTAWLRIFTHHTSPAQFIRRPWYGYYYQLVIRSSDDMVFWRLYIYTVVFNGYVQFTVIDKWKIANIKAINVVMHRISILRWTLIFSGSSLDWVSPPHEWMCRKMDTSSLRKSNHLYIRSNWPSFFC